LAAELECLVWVVGAVVRLTDRDLAPVRMAACGRHTDISVTFAVVSTEGAQGLYALETPRDALRSLHF